MTHTYIPQFKPRTPKPQKEKIIWGFDIETAEQNKQFICAVFVTHCHTTNQIKKRICKTKTQVKTFLDSLNPCKNCIVATNLAFDFFGVIGLHESQLFRQQERNGILYAIKYKNPTKSYKSYLMFYDTTRYMSATVETLGKICGIEKLPHPTCFGTKPVTQQQWDELLHYCTNDAYISQQFFYRFIYRYCQEKGLQVKTTISAISMQEFRTHYLKKTYTVESPKIHEIAFKSYKGGRVEVFQRGTFHNIQYYDFNSLYPSVMQENVPDPSTSHYCKQVTLWDIENREGMCYIEAYQEYRYVPLLSIKKDNKLITPTGEIKGYFTFIELRTALKDGLHIYSIGEGVVYTKTVPLLKEFVRDKYAIRLKQKQNKDPMEITTKLIMNGNYGKYGQKYDTQSQILSQQQLTKNVIRNATCISELSHGYFRIDSPASQPPNHSFPAIAAYITAYARIKLYNALKQYQDRLIYCDTDSLFLTQGKHIPNSTCLGELKHEGDFVKGVFARPKMYGLQEESGVEHIKIKGLKTKINLTRMSQIVQGNKITEQHFVKLRTVLSSKPHHKFGTLLPNQIIEKEKRFNPNDTKRDWNDIPFIEQEQHISYPLHLTEHDYT